MNTLASAVGSVVLVHGGFVDGSGWEDVYKILKKACITPTSGPAGFLLIT